MKRLVFFWVFTLVSILGFSSKPGAPILDAKIVGIVKDYNNKKPIEFATVSLHKRSDKSLVTGSVADASGRFELRKIEAGSYYIRIGFIGYTDREIDLPSIEKQRFIDLGILELKISAQNLEAIEIQGEQKIMETHIDKKVFNVSKDPTSQGGTGVDAMRNVPGVEVDVDGNISLRGDQNVRILVDGRPISIPANQFLEQTPANSIEKIEIVTNPSAKYDPEGTTGILNIILKKEKRGGLFGSANASIGYGWYPKSNNSVSANYRSGKWSLQGNVGINSGEYGSRSTQDTDYQDDTDDFHSEGEGSRLMNSVNAKFGVDYFATDNDIVYGSISMRGADGDMRNTLESDFTDFNGNPNTNSIRTTKGNAPGSSMTYNAGYQKKFSKKGHTMDIDWNLNTNYSESNNFNLEKFYNGRGDTALLYSDGQDQFDVDDDAIMQTKLDYVYPFNDSVSLETGYMHTLNMDRDQQLVFSQSLNPEALSDDTLYSNFEFNRNTHAVYGILSGQFNKLGVKAGLRVENTVRTATLLSEEKEDNFDYLSAFPSLHLTYKLTETKELLVSASRRLNRPRSSQLNPFNDFTNPRTTRRGNPFLKPEFVQVYELGFMENKGALSYTVTGYYRYLTDMIRRVLILGENNVNSVTFTNQDRAQFYGVEANINYRFKNGVRSNLNINAFETKYDPDPLNPTQNNISRSISFNLMMSKRFKNGLSAQVNGRYRAPMDVIQGRISDMYGIDLGARQPIWNNAGSIGLRVSDIFNTRRFAFDSEDIGQLFSVSHKWESRTVYLTFSYNFGKRVKGPQRRVKREKMDNFDRVDF